MTREDAIYWLGVLKMHSEKRDAQTITEALDMAIEALQNDDRKTEPQTYITEDRDTQILDAWQVHHRNMSSAKDEPQTDCVKVGKWYSFNDYVVEMQGEGKPKEFRVIPMEKYLDTTDEPLTFCKHTERSE